MKKIVIIALMTFALFLCKADVLLWQVDDTAKVESEAVIEMLKKKRESLDIDEPTNFLITFDKSERGTKVS